MAARLEPNATRPLASGRHKGRSTHHRCGPRSLLASARINPVEGSVATAALVREGLAPETFEPRHGWANWAWIGSNHVVRVSSGRLRSSLSHEAAVVAALAGSPVPMASVIAHGQVSELLHGWRGDINAEWIISTRVSGDTLATVWPELSSADRRLVGADIGRILCSLHEREVPDLAPRWWVDSHRDRAQLHNAYRPGVTLGPTLVDAARDLPSADHALLDDVEAFLHERMPLFADDEVVFVHGDVHAHNLMVVGGPVAISALLDWEGAHPAARDVELDMLLRYISAAHAFPERPGVAAEIAPGDMLELVSHIGSAYPELFSGQHLPERLEVYDVHWHLVQLLVHHHFHGDFDGTQQPAWRRLADLLVDRSHIRLLKL